MMSFGRRALTTVLWARWYFPFEVVLFALLHVTYSVSRWWVRPTGAEIPAALEHADQIIRTQEALGLHIEPGLQRWVNGIPGGEWLVTTIYTYGHTPSMLAFFVLVWFTRRGWYPYVRNAFWIAHILAVLTFWLWPLAPPRLANIGMLDPTEEALRVHGWLDWFQQFRNEYAAMPSFHIGYSAFFAAMLFFLLAGRRWRGIVWVWPALILFVTMATANHFWLDGVGGIALMSAACAIAAVVLPRAMPRPWNYPDEGVHEAAPTPTAPVPAERGM